MLVVAFLDRDLLDEVKNIFCIKRLSCGLLARICGTFRNLIVFFSGASLMTLY